jgi:hypothetical protein
MALDWPLSNEEKKGCLLKLYDFERTLGDQLLAIRHDIAMRRAATVTAGGHPNQVPAACQQSSRESSSATLHGEMVLPRRCKRPERRDPQDNFASDAVEHFQMAFASAAAALGTLLGNGSGGLWESDDDAVVEETRPRARSEGANRSEVSFSSALRKPNSRRNSRGGPLERRVSFAESTDTADREEDDMEPLCEPEPTEEQHQLQQRKQRQHQKQDIPSSTPHPAALAQLQGYSSGQAASASSNYQSAPISTPQGAGAVAQRRGRQRARLRGSLHAYSMSAQ